MDAGDGHPAKVSFTSNRPNTSAEQHLNSQRNDTEAFGGLVQDPALSYATTRSMAAKQSPGAPQGVPSTEGGQAYQELTADLPEWRHDIGTVDDAEQWLETDKLKHANKVDLGDNDDAEWESQFILIHAMELFNAIFAEPPVADLTWTAKAIKYFKTYQDNGMEVVDNARKTEDGRARTQSRCFLVLRELFKLHNEGLPKGSKTAGFDGTLKASERIKEVIKCAEIKHIAKVIVEGHPKGISDLVQDPKGLYKARKDAAGGNSVKHAYTEAGRKNTVESLKNKAPTKTNFPASSTADPQDDGANVAQDGDDGPPAKKRRGRKGESDAPTAKPRGRRERASNFSQTQGTNPVLLKTTSSSLQQPSRSDEGGRGYTSQTLGPAPSAEPGQMVFPRNFASQNELATQGYVDAPGPFGASFARTSQPEDVVDPSLQDDQPGPELYRDEYDSGVSHGVTFNGVHYDTNNNYGARNSTHLHGDGEQINYIADNASGALNATHSYDGEQSHNNSSALESNGNYDTVAPGLGVYALEDYGSDEYELLQ